MNSVFSDFANSLITYCRSLSQFCGYSPWQPMPAILCTRSLLGFETRPPASRQYCVEAAANSLTCRAAVALYNKTHACPACIHLWKAQKQTHGQCQAHCWHCSCQRRSFESRVPRELYPSGVRRIGHRYVYMGGGHCCLGNF